MRKHYRNDKLLPVLALALILICLLSGFSVKSDDSLVQYHLEERTKLMQDCFYGKISIAEAEEKLNKYETQPLLSNDIKSLREWGRTEVDKVKKMSFTKIEKQQELLGYKTYIVDIIWEMTGLSEDYIVEESYYVVLKKVGDKDYISQIEPL